MTFVQEIASTNQQPQFGVESTWGTPVACNRLIKTLDIVPAINGQTTPYTPTGNRYPSAQEQDWEQLDFTIGGIMCYNALAYLLPGEIGRAHV